jgi:predicted DNA-binding transcriptional regulator YafY
VKFTDVGIEMFNLLKVDKPKILSRERNEIEVECSIFKAKLYFSQFLDEVEILEPIELREWFKEKYTKAVSVYC